MQLPHDVVCPTLVGREPEVGAVRAVIERARAGSGQVALIVGEAGVGKSRVALWSDHNRATDGTTRVQSEYLEVVGVVT